jgi:hypothetical protein
LDRIVTFARHQAAEDRRLPSDEQRGEADAENDAQVSALVAVAF